MTEPRRREAEEEPFAVCRRFAEANGIPALLQAGAVVGFSGGADSVFLLHLMEKMRQDTPFPITAVHVHHGIRGAEADGDEAFCRDFCAARGIPFLSYHVDVPAIAARDRIGEEACARRERYRLLAQAKEETGARWILTAHNATDQAETVLMHLLRGCGSRGLSGMDAVGTDVLRPMLCLRGEEIRRALDEAGIAYRRDSSNQNDGYRRNFVRHRVLPLLQELVPDPVAAILRASGNVKADDACLTRQAEQLLREAKTEKGLSRAALRQADDAVAVRALAAFCRDGAENGVYPERCHLTEGLRQIRSGDTRFSVSLPGGRALRGDGDRIFLSKDREETVPEPFCVPLSVGDNILPDGSILRIQTTQNKNADPARNVYKLSIQAELSSATIADGWFARSRKEGDRYRYGGMTRIVRRQLACRKIPLALRERLPVITDSEGILWVPFLRERDRASEGPTCFVTYLIKD